MTNEMGRKETRYLQTLNCDSMAQQNLKMRPVLLKRNSLDSADFMRRPQHRRTKSQQVRFKDDGVHTETELDTNPAQDLAFTTGKTEIFRDHNFLLHWSPSFPRAQKGLRNIAIQTSPSLRKHYPVFKKKKLAVSKSLTEMPTEPSNSIQINGDLSEQDLMSSDLCYLRITDHLEDGYRNSEADSKLSERPSKAQSNGPIHSEDFSVSEKTTVSTQVPEYIHVSFPQEVENCSVSTDAPDATTNLSNSLHSSAVINNNESNENSILSSNSEKAYPCLSNSANCSECNAHSDSWEADKSDSGPLIVSKDVSSKETTPLRPPSNHNSSPCCLRDYQQAGEHKTGSSCVTLANDDHTIISLSSSNTSKSVLSCNTEIEKISAQSDVSQCNSCLEGFHIKSHPQRNEIKSQANKEISEINQNHLAHGELCALQGRLQSVEESLQSNQEKIKVLLNVIQDLEKSRALSEGFMVSDTKPLTLRVSSCHPGKICMQQSNKTQQSDVLMECYRHLQQDNYLLPARRNFYHTGQDLDNCSTCQNTACIIYSVEYDFRQQEGRFHQILKALDQAEENPAPASPQKLPTDHPDPEKKELRRKTKKMKRKCFWWI